MMSNWFNTHTRPGAPYAPAQAEAGSGPNKLRKAQPRPSPANPRAPAEVDAQTGPNKLRKAQPQPRSAAVPDTPAEAKTGPNKLRKPPPPLTASERLQRASKRTPWYAEQALHERYVQHLAHQRPIDAGEDAALRRQFHFVATGQDLACCLVNGKLLHWTAAEQSWSLAKNIGPVKSLHFGANRQMNVLTADGVLLALDASGKPSGTFAALKLPADVLDFAISPTGSVAFISADKPNLIGFLDAGQRRDGGQQVVWGQGAPGQSAAGVASMAFQHDGTLLLLDKNGQLSEGRRAPPQADQAGPVTTQEVRWSAPRAQRTEAGPGHGWLTRLQVLPDGSVGALDQDHHPLARGKDDVWRPAPPAVGAAHQFYGNFQSAARGRWNVGGLAAPLAFGEQNWRKDRPWWKPGMFHRSHPDERLRSRHANWFGAHQPFQLTKGAWGQVKAGLHDTIAADRATLGDPAALTPLAADHALRADPHLLPAVERNTDAILQALRARLGIWDEQGREIAGFQHGAVYKQVRGSPAQVNSPVNVLHQLYTTRSQLFGPDDAQARQLKRLLEKNVFLGFDSDRHLTMPAGKVTMPSAIERPATAAAGVDAGDVEKLWRDHGMRALAAAAARAKPGDPAAAALSAEIGRRVDDNTGAVLARWEALPDASEQADPDHPDHPLASLLAARGAQYGKTDPLLLRLREAARNKPMRFEIDLADEEAGMDLPRLLKNKFAVYTGKMLHDHAILADLARQDAPTAGRIAAGAAELDGPAPDPERDAAAADAVAANAAAGDAVAGGPRLNQITRLYQSGFVNLDRVDRFLEAYDFLNGGLTDPGHKLGRALTGQGELREPLVGAYQNMVRSMKPGESINLNSSTGGGLDAEGMSQFMKFKAIPLITGLVTAQAFAIEPVNQIAASRSYGLSIGKNADGGITIAVNKSTNVTALPVAAKIQQGVGVAGKPGSAPVTLFGYAGMNTKIRLGATERTENVASFSIAADDYGRVDKVLAGLLGGTLSPFDLMQLADDASNTRQASTTLAANLDIEPLLAGGVVASLNDAAYHEQAKAIVAAVGQLNFEAKRTLGHDSTEASDGRRSNKLIDKTEFGIGVTGIAVLEGQIADARNMPGGEKNGYENQNKLPVAIAVASKQLYGSSLVSDGYTQHYNAAGHLDEISTTVTAKNSSDGDNAIRAMRDNYTNPNRHFIGKHLPQLQELMDSNPEVRAPLEKMIASRLPLEVSMQLKPHILEQVRQYKGVGGSATQAEIQRFIAEKMATPANLRIVNIGATDANTYKTSWSTGILALRYQSGAENTFRSPWANIHVRYAATAEGRPSVELSDHALPSVSQQADAAQIERVLRDGGPALLDFLSNPVGADPLRQRHAAAVGDIMRRLRQGEIADPEQLEPEQVQALAAFFPPGDPGATLTMASILNDHDRLSLFLKGLRPEAPPATATAALTAATKPAPANRLQRLLRPELEPLTRRAADLRAIVRDRALGEPAKRGARAELAKVEQQIAQERDTNALVRAVKQLGGADVRPKAVLADTGRYSESDLRILRDNRQLAPATRLAAAAELAERAARAAIPAGGVAPEATRAGALLEAALREAMAAPGLALSGDARPTAAWLATHGVEAAPNPASGNPRLLHALLQHASADYGYEHAAMAGAIQAELVRAGHSVFADGADGEPDGPALAAAMAAVGRRYPQACFDASLLSPHQPPRRLPGGADGEARAAVLVFQGEHGWSALRMGAPHLEADLRAAAPEQEAALRRLDADIGRVRADRHARDVFEPRPATAMAGLDAALAAPGAPPPAPMPRLDVGAPVRIAPRPAPPADSDAAVLRQATTLLDGVRRVEQDYLTRRKSHTVGALFAKPGPRARAEQAFRAVSTPEAQQATTQLRRALAELSENASAQQAQLRGLEQCAFELGGERAPAARTALDRQRAALNERLAVARRDEAGLRARLRVAVARMAPLHLPD